tara:strand:- start:2227 stop:2700 length:474 start_codon:yes stop_codon:yes gene_type:complete
MAIFSGKIIEAYYTNTDNDSVEVIYEEGKRAINHYLPMDMGHPDVKALLKEYPLAKIADTTVARNKEAIKQLNRVVEAKVKQKIEDKPMQNFDSVMDFIINYDSKKQAEDLFSLKLKIFEKDIVKDFSDNDIKTKIRQAKTPLDVLLAYRDIVVKNR